MDEGDSRTTKGLISSSDERTTKGVISSIISEIISRLGNLINIRRIFPYRRNLIGSSNDKRLI